MKLVLDQQSRSREASYYISILKRREYSEYHKIILWQLPFNVFHKALADIALNYEPYRKIIKQLEGGYTESSEMRNNFPFMLFPRYRFLIFFPHSKRNIARSAVARYATVLSKLASNPD